MPVSKNQCIFAILYAVYVCVGVGVGGVCEGVYISGAGRGRVWSLLGADSCEAGPSGSSSICSGSISHNHRS